MPSSLWDDLDDALSPWLDLGALRVAWHTDDPTDEMLWAIEEGASYAWGPVLGSFFQDLVLAALGSGLDGEPVEWA